MDWKDIGEEIAKVGLPLLGAALPFPGGAALGAALASHLGMPGAKPEDILAKLTQDSAAQEKAKEFEMQNQTNILQIHINAEIAQRQADSADIGSVNKTMQAEDASPAGAAGWRKACGYIVAFGSGITVVAVIGLSYLTVFKNEPIALQAIPALVFAITTVLAIPGSAVGIVAWHEGQAARAKAAVSGQGS